jgi:hypothetical protein
MDMRHLALIDHHKEQYLKRHRIAGSSVSGAFPLSKLAGRRPTERQQVLVRQSCVTEQNAWAISKNQAVKIIIHHQY